MTCDEMRYIALFESISGASVKDCIIDEEQERAIFIVNPGQVGVAIGKGGRNIHTLERMTGKKHEIIEYSEDPVQFIKNALKPAAVREVRITEKTDGKKMAVVTINPKDKGVAIGKNGKNAERLRFLAKRYFDIQNVSIT
ncbi:MAG: NusA-like transcription termination signal-binding factor [Candidatus Bathyarchaeota archaeon]|nr:NusA-like transcription termination signal-binding factor [Candidatus Bathyarchaeota archaeon]